GSRSRFVSVGVLEKDAVAATDGSLAVTKRIPCEAKAWSGVKQVSGVTPDGHSVLAAGDQTVEGISADAAVRVDGAGALHIFRGIEVVRLELGVARGPEHTDPQAEVKG